MDKHNISNESLHSSQTIVTFSEACDKMRTFKHRIRKMFHIHLENLKKNYKEKNSLYDSRLSTPDKMVPYQRTNILTGESLKCFNSATYDLYAAHRFSRVCEHRPNVLDQSIMLLKLAITAIPTTTSGINSPDQLLHELNKSYFNYVSKITIFFDASKDVDQLMKYDIHEPLAEWVPRRRDLESSLTTLLFKVPTSLKKDINGTNKHYNNRNIIIEIEPAEQLNIYAVHHSLLATYLEVPYCPRLFNGKYTSGEKCEGYSVKELIRIILSKVTGAHPSMKDRSLTRYAYITEAAFLRAKRFTDANQLLECEKIGFSIQHAGLDRILNPVLFDFPEKWCSQGVTKTFIRNLREKKNFPDRIPSLVLLDVLLSPLFIYKSRAKRFLYPLDMSRSTEGTPSQESPTSDTAIRSPEIMLLEKGMCIEFAATTEPSEIASKSYCEPTFPAHTYELLLFHMRKDDTCVNQYVHHILFHQRVLTSISAQPMKWIRELVKSRVRKIREDIPDIK